MRPVSPGAVENAAGLKPPHQPGRGGREPPLAPTAAWGACPALETAAARAGSAPSRLRGRAANQRRARSPPAEGR